MANCLKCGVEITEGNNFCDSCIAVMEQHPIPQGTPVVIHKRPARNPKSKRKRQTQADTIRKLYKRLRFVTYLCGFLTLLVAVLAGMLIYTIYF